MNKVRGTSFAPQAILSQFVVEVVFDSMKVCFEAAFVNAMCKLVSSRAWLEVFLQVLFYSRFE